MPHDPNIRVRFAPSPTGDPHIGSMWTALFNWLFARHTGGTFVLRIEDTDQKRTVPGSTEKIFEALDWYGITPDEGPKQGGPYGPYTQSQRLERYQTYAKQLVALGAAYYCFCTLERLESVRAAQTQAKQPPRYDKHCATLKTDEVERRLTAGESATIRLRLPESGTVEHQDVIRGRVSFRYDLLDDSVILKTDGFPTYHLANVVDDYEMKISHVIRAEEWLPSVPKHLFLYRAFGWQPPQFAHLPLLLGTDRAKLSKRHGATSALSFRDLGYLPEALTNFLTLMGWHPKDDREVMTREEVVEAFSLEGVNPSGAVFDMTKLEWLNGHYIRALAPDDLFARVRSFWNIPPEQQADSAWLLRALELVRDRMKTLQDVNVVNTVFSTVWTERRSTFDESLLVPKKGTSELTRHHLAQSAVWLEQYSDSWEAATLKSRMLEAIASMGKKNGEILWPIRVALSLETASPDVFDLLALLGKAESLRRIKSFAE